MWNPGGQDRGDDPTALIRVNCFGFKRPGTATKINNAKSVPAQYPISLRRAYNRWSGSNHFYSEHVERPKPTGGAQCTGSSYSPSGSRNEMHPLVNAILGVGRQAISEPRNRITRRRAPVSCASFSLQPLCKPQQLGQTDWFRLARRADSQPEIPPANDSSGRRSADP